MSIIELLQYLDTHLFLIINGFHSTFFDSFMWAVSAKLTWIPFYLSVLYILIRLFKKDSVWVILSVVLCIVISDQVASGLLKELVRRLRPSHVDSLKPFIHLVKGYEGGLYGFASSHAANSAAFAILTSLIFSNRYYTIFILFWAALISYSRIYLGVHYPLDIMGGIAIGVVAALFCFRLLIRLHPQSFKNQVFHTPTSQNNIPLWVFSLTLAGIVVYSIVL